MKNQIKYVAMIIIALLISLLLLKLYALSTEPYTKYELPEITFQKTVAGDSIRFEVVSITNSSYAYYSDYLCIVQNNTGRVDWYLNIVENYTDGPTIHDNDFDNRFSVGDTLDIPIQYSNNKESIILRFVPMGISSFEGEL